MPELPEVEVVRRDLDRVWRDATITSVVVTGRRSVRRYDDPQVFVDRLVGSRITGVGRRGKHLLVHLADGGVLVIHLRMSGQLLLVRDDAPPPKHTHVVITVDSGDIVRFVDPRTFGEMFVTTADLPELAHFGIEPLDPLTTPATLGALLHNHAAALKPFLLDQRRIVGIGNIYSDEMLFRAGLRPDRRTDSLSDDDVARLFDAMVAVLQAAIAGRGSSLADAQYVDVYGNTGGYAAEHLVHAREGAPCPRCGRAILRTKIAGRSTYICEQCQR